MPALNAISPEKLARLVGTPTCPAIVEVKSAGGGFIPGPCAGPPTRSLHGRRACAAVPPSSSASPEATPARGWPPGSATRAWQPRYSKAAPPAGARPGCLCSPTPCCRRATRGTGRPGSPAPAQGGQDRLPVADPRFVDPDAVFLFVAPGEVAGVSERFGAAPFDVEGDIGASRRAVHVRRDGRGVRARRLPGVAAPRPDRARCRHGPAGARAAGGGPAGGVARPVAHVRRRSRAARGGNDALRRPLPLVPRRGRRNS